MDFKEISDVASGISVASLVIIALIGGLRRWWMFTWNHDEAMKVAKEYHDQQVQQFEQRIAGLETRLTGRESELDDMRDLMQDKFLPALTQASHIVEEAIFEKRRQHSDGAR